MSDEPTEPLTEPQLMRSVIDGREYAVYPEGTTLDDLLAEARREGAAEVAKRVEGALIDTYNEDTLAVRLSVRAALRGDT